VLGERRRTDRYGRTGHWNVFRACKRVYGLIADWSTISVIPNVFFGFGNYAGRNTRTMGEGRFAVPETDFVTGVSENIPEVAGRRPSFRRQTGRSRSRVVYSSRRAFLRPASVGDKSPSADRQTTNTVGRLRRELRTARIGITCVSP